MLGRDPVDLEDRQALWLIDRAIWRFPPVLDRKALSVGTEFADRPSRKLSKQRWKTKLDSSPQDDFEAGQAILSAWNQSLAGEVTEPIRRLS